MIRPVRFGLFTSPLHAPGVDPYLLLKEDMDLARFIDTLGYDEFWVGEHHSGGWASLTSPELFIAAAAQQTRHIKFATGVLGLPYHHPLLVAERAVMLDHLTDGRFILGVGSGAYQADMRIMGIDPATTRQRMAESVEVIKRLLAGDCVSTRTDWFEINEGRLQLMAFRRPIEIVVASAATPFSMKLAGTLKLNAMSHVAPPWGAIRAGQDIGVGRLPQQWNFLSEINTEADRADWRLVVPLHVSDSESQAKSELFAGWQFQRQDLYQKTLGVPIPTMEIAQTKAFEYTIGQGGIIAGSPDDCYRAIVKLADAVGGFGSLLISYQDWADKPARLRSLELFARHVAPRLRNALKNIDASQEWVAGKSREFVQSNAEGRAKAMD